MNDFNFWYQQLLRVALNEPVQRNERTGEDVAVIRGGMSFRVDLSNGLMPLPSLRRVYAKSAAAEIAWFLMGTQDVTWLMKHAPFWNKFVELDGKTIEAAYGHRWAEHFSIDQLHWAIDILKKDPSNRRVYISTWDPVVDLGMLGQKNVPCPVGFTLSIDRGELHSSMLIRSSDLFVGLPYDVLGHSMLVAALARSLDVKPGVLTFTLAHPHLYTKHFGMAQDGLDGMTQALVPEVPLLEYSVADIKAKPDYYVTMTNIWSQNYEKAVTYAPRPDIIP